MHFSFTCVFIVALIPYFAKLIMTVALTRQGKYNNRHPRDQQAKLTGWPNRAIAAQLNGFECFPIFATFVILAEMTHANEDLVDPLCAIFVVLRVAYTALYIADKPSARSMVWFASFGVLFTLGALSLF